MLIHLLVHSIHFVDVCLGPFLAHFWPLWAHLGADFTTLRVPNGPNGPQSAPVGPLALIRGPEVRFMDTFWSILTHFFVDSSDPFLTSEEVISSLLVFTSWKSLSALVVLFFTDVLLCTICSVLHRCVLRRLPRFEVPACRYRFREALLRL